jgi:hypothetical protein
VSDADAAKAAAEETHKAQQAEIDRLRAERNEERRQHAETKEKAARTIKPPTPKPSADPAVRPPAAPAGPGAKTRRRGRWSWFPAESSDE